MKIYNLQPLKRYLHIFQLEEYKVSRFVKWLFREKKKVVNIKKELVFTTKAKFLYFTSIFLYLSTATFLYLYFDIYLTLAYLIIFWNAIFIFLIIAFYLLKFYEIPNRVFTKRRIKKIFAKNSGVKVISITGSAGKTTTKNILSLLLTGKVLKTPKSFNTLFGIAKMIDLEMDNRYDYFICEMGAYKRGEIKELMNTIPTDVGVLTTINKQHVERFKSIKNTTKAKFEILQHTKVGGLGVVNLDNEYILNNLELAKSKLYGFTKNLDRLKAELSKRKLALVKQTISAKNVRIASKRMTFTLTYKRKNYKFTTSLLGNHHLTNILAALTVSLLLGEKIKDLQEKVLKIPQIPHRLEYKYQNGLNILDDTYSSNEEGFREALKVLDSFQDGQKILVTPGIVELDDKTKDVHIDLGKQAAEIIDYLILVGKSDRTKYLEKGIKKKRENTRVFFVDSHQKAQEKITQLARTDDCILFENDLPDQYL